MSSEEGRAESYYILELASAVLGTLEHFTPRRVLVRDEPVGPDDSEQAQRNKRRKANELTDKWVLANMAFSLACFLWYCLLHRLLRVLHAPKPLVSGTLVVLAAPVALYAGWQVYGIVVAQLCVLLAHPPAAERASQPYWVESHIRSLVLALLNYATVLFWFAFVYRAVHFLYLDPGKPDSLFRALYASLATMSLLGASDLRPKGPLGYLLLLTQLALALVMQIVVLAQAVGALRRKDLAEVRDASENQDHDHEAELGSSA